jgi:hypothetical protein
VGLAPGKERIDRLLAAPHLPFKLKKSAIVDVEGRSLAVGRAPNASSVACGGGREARLVGGGRRSGSGKVGVGERKKKFVGFLRMLG